MVATVVLAVLPKVIVSLLAAEVEAVLGVIVVVIHLPLEVVVKVMAAIR
jgi:hypothetical protein